MLFSQKRESINRDKENLCVFLGTTISRQYYIFSIPLYFSAVLFGISVMGNVICIILFLRNRILNRIKSTRQSKPNRLDSL